MQIMLLIAVFFGYFSIALALPLENSIKNVFFRGMYTAEVCILSPTDILGVAASDALETQNAVSGGASTTKTIRSASQLTVLYSSE